MVSLPFCSCEAAAENEHSYIVDFEDYEFCNFDDPESWFDDDLYQGWELADTHKTDVGIYAGSQVENAMGCYPSNDHASCPEHLQVRWNARRAGLSEH
jgi:hypothetical protein